MISSVSNTYNQTAPKKPAFKAGVLYVKIPKKYQIALNQNYLNTAITASKEFEILLDIYTKLKQGLYKFSKTKEYVEKNIRAIYFSPRRKTGNALEVHLSLDENRLNGFAITSGANSRSWVQLYNNGRENIPFPNLTEDSVETTQLFEKIKIEAKKRIPLNMRKEIPTK